MEDVIGWPNKTGAGFEHCMNSGSAVLCDTKNYTNNTMA